jgi:two-component system, chemotaxis family, CheB/CheR fusion protein
MPEQSGQQSVLRSGQGTPTPEALYSLVVIGASAGGIEALSTVLGALTVDFPAPIVIAQHLDPTRPSHLDAILARRTSWWRRTEAAWRSPR